MNNNYVFRKQQELNILNSYLSKPFSIGKLNNVDQVLKIKNKIVDGIRTQSRNRFSHHLTNNNQISFKSELFDYSYTYERFNGFIFIDKFANVFYNISSKYYSSTFFTNCGMTAITSLLSSMCLSNNISIDLLYEETYFETMKYINIVNKNSSLKALYIDSIASDFDFKLNEELIKKYNYIIIDSTCFIGKKYSGMIKNIVNLNIPCILVRSITKLDMVGTEYSHMGSVSFIYKKSIMNEKFEKIINDCKHLIGVYGACLIPEKFPPFLLDKKLIKLNEKRINIVQSNNELAFKILSKNGFNVVLPNHMEFCLVYIGKIDFNLDILKNKIIKFCESEKKSVYHAVSFGFDYVSIDCYQNFLDNSIKFRICMNDDSVNNIKIIVNDFIKFIKNDIINK